MSLFLKLMYTKKCASVLPVSKSKYTNILVAVINNLICNGKNIYVNKVSRNLIIWMFRVPFVIVLNDDFNVAYHCLFVLGSFCLALVFVIFSLVCFPLCCAYTFLISRLANHDFLSFGGLALTMHRKIVWWIACCSWLLYICFRAAVALALIAVCSLFTIAICALRS